MRQAENTGWEEREVRHGQSANRGAGGRERETERQIARATSCKDMKVTPRAENTTARKRAGEGRAVAQDSKQSKPEDPGNSRQQTAVSKAREQ